MTTKFPCYIEFTNDGRYMRIVHKSNLIIGEFLVDSETLRDRAETAHDRLELKPNLRRQLKPYFGDIQSLRTPQDIYEEIEVLKEILKLENLVDKLMQIKLNEKNKD